MERVLDVETMPTQYRLTVEAMDGAETPRRYNNIIPQSHRRGPMGSAAYFRLRQGGEGEGWGGPLFSFKG